MAMWKDTSSFAQGATDRTPKDWTMTVHGGRICVHRHRDYPGVWCLSAYFWGGRVFDARPLDAESLADAQALALLKVDSELRAALDDIHLVLGA